MVMGGVLGQAAIIIYCDMRVAQHDTAIPKISLLYTFYIINSFRAYLAISQPLRRRPRASDVGCGTHYNYVKVISLCNSIYML